MHQRGDVRNQSVQAWRSRERKLRHQFRGGCWFHGVEALQKAWPDSRRWRFMRDYAKRELLSPLSQAFRQVVTEGWVVASSYVKSIPRLWTIMCGLAFPVCARGKIAIRGPCICYAFVQSGVCANLLLKIKSESIACDFRGWEITRGERGGGGMVYCAIWQKTVNLIFIF